MTEKERKEYRDMLGDDLMEMVFDMGFEEWYDENADTLAKQWEKETKEVKPDSKTGDAELDEILSVLEKMCDDKDEDEDDDLDVVKGELVKLANDVFKEDGTLPSGTWDTIKGAVNPKLPEDGSMFAFAVCCDGDDIYVITEEGHKKFDIFKDGKMPKRPTADDLTKALSVIVYRGLTSLIYE